MVYSGDDTELLEAAGRISSADDFAAYAALLLEDFYGNAARWNNACIHSYLEAIGFTVHYVVGPRLRGDGAGQGAVPPWRMFAAILHAARFYGMGDFEEWAGELAEEVFGPAAVATPAG